MPGATVSAQRAPAATAPREPLFALTLPLADAPSLEGNTLVVLLPLRDAPGTLDVEDSLQRLADLVVPLLADWVIISLVDEGAAGPTRSPPGTATGTRRPWPAGRRSSPRR